MHNNIMAVGSRDRPPMLAMGRYAQWQLCFLRYIDTRPNGDALRKCILKGPYTPSTIIIPVVPATDDSPEEFRKAKREKDSMYHKEKILLCKQVEKGVPVQAEQADWLAKTDEEIDEQEMEAHYSYMAKIQEVHTIDSGTDTEPLEQVQYNAECNVFANKRQYSEQPKSISNTCVVEKVDSNVIPDSLDTCDNDIQTNQNAKECDDERATLANVISNLKLDVDENKKIQKQLKKANTSLAHELKEYKSILAKTSRTLGESNSIQDRLLAQKEIDIKEGLQLKACEISVVKEKHDELVKQSFLTKSHYEGFVKEKTKVITDLKLKEEKDIDKMISMEKHLKFLNGIVYKRNQSIQTIHMLARKGSTFNGRPTFANTVYLKKAQSEKPCLYEITYDTSDPANRFVRDREETLNLEKESRLKLNKDLVRPYDYTNQNSLYENFKPVSQQYHEQLAHAYEYVKSLEEEIDELGYDKAEFSNIYDILLQEPQLRSTQIKDKVVPNNSRVKPKKTEVEDHHRISTISKKIKSINACNNSLKSKTSNVNAVCATYGKCVSNLNHDACVSKFLNDTNARAKKPKVVPISTRKPKSQMNKYVATHPKKTVASESTNQISKSYYRMLYEKTSKAWK
uniref:Integrase, catalytic region, zinc finger, CCHC-type, peptidase aspartic, catalytic n=1 Tax=Tanacetum cinerariifolium TaxID=118510 RepID=A0A6L2NL69_TANCI|nr:hypothetical protein [Tanacetum cinerariifolium]